MPRVSIKAPEYKAKDACTYIRGRMCMEGITLTELATELGCTKQSLNYRFQNAALTIEDLVRIFRYMKFTDTEIAKVLRL